MKRIATDESEHTAADRSDLRITNPWLASYGRYAVRAPRPSTPAAPNLRLWVGAGGAVLLVLGIGATQYVAAQTPASPGHHPLAQSGGIAALPETIVQGVAQSRLTAESAEEQPLLDNRAQSPPMEPLR
jgi:hypothetical protein